MKSNGCRDVQHTGYKAHKQEGTLVSKGHLIGPSSQASYISGCTACMSNNQAVFSLCCNLELISISYNYDAATDVGMLGKICRSSALCTLLTSVPSCLCAL